LRGTSKRQSSEGVIWCAWDSKQAKGLCQWTALPHSFKATSQAQVHPQLAHKCNDRANPARTHLCPMRTSLNPVCDLTSDRRHRPPAGNEANRFSLDLQGGGYLPVVHRLVFATGCAFLIGCMPRHFAGARFAQRRMVESGFDESSCSRSNSRFTTLRQLPVLLAIDRAANGHPLAGLRHDSLNTGHSQMPIGCVRYGREYPGLVVAD